MLQPTGPWLVPKHIPRAPLSGFCSCCFFHLEFPTLTSFKLRLPFRPLSIFCDSSSIFYFVLVACLLDVSLSMECRLWDLALFHSGLCPMQRRCSLSKCLLNWISMKIKEAELNGNKTAPNLIALVCCFILSPVETVSEVLSTRIDPSARWWCWPFRCWVRIHPISLLPAPQSRSWSFLIWMDVGSLYRLFSSIPLTWTCSCWSHLKSHTRWCPSLT